MVSLGSFFRVVGSKKPSAVFAQVVKSLEMAPPVRGIWQGWQGIRAGCVLRVASLWGLPVWQSRQAIRTPSLAQLFGSKPVGILWSLALWQSTQTIPLAA